MALWICEACTTKYSVDAPRCPHCGSTEYREDGAMPKSTVHTGDSNEAAEAEMLGAATVGAPRIGETDPELTTESDGGDTDAASASSNDNDRKAPAKKVAPAKAAAK